MSVRLSERKESNLKYVQLGQQLCQHTFQLCNNPNHFPEPILPNAIKQEVIEILKNIRYLLSTVTLDKTNSDNLTKYTIDAFAHIDALYSLLELAYNDKTYKIKPTSMEYWVGLVVQLEQSLEKLGSISIC